MKKTKSKRKKDYLESIIKLMLHDGENFENYTSILGEYKTAYITRKEITNNLFKEIKTIKKLKV